MMDTGWAVARKPAPRRRLRAVQERSVRALRTESGRAIATNVQRLRGSQSQRQLAADAGVSPSALSALERGELPGFEVLARVAIALSVPVWALAAPPEGIVWAYRQAHRADRVRALYALRAAAKWPEQASLRGRVARTCDACPLRAVEGAGAVARGAEHRDERAAERADGDADLIGRRVAGLAEAPHDDLAEREPDARAGDDAGTVASTHLILPRIGVYR